MEEDRTDKKALLAEIGTLRQRVASLEQEVSALRESEHKFRLMAETIEDVFWMSSPGIDRMLYVSPAYEELWQESCESLYRSPKRFLEAIHPDDRERIEAMLQDHAAGEWSCEYRLLLPDGTVRWIHDRGFPIRNDDGSLCCMTGVATDISERREMEESLRRTNQLYENIFSNIHMQIAYLDCEFNFIRVNEAYARTCGRDAGFFVGKNHFDLYPHEENEAIFKRVVASGIPSVVHEKPFEFPDQPERGVTYWDWSLIPLKAEDDSVFALLFCLVDVTERKKSKMVLEEALAESQHLATELAQKNSQIREQNRKLAEAYGELQRTQKQVVQQEKLATIGQLAAGVAHEINNPLSFVASNLATLAKYFERLRAYIDGQTEAIASVQGGRVSSELEELRERLKLDPILEDIMPLIDESREGAERLKGIVLDLKSFSRRDDGEMMPADVNACLESTLNIVWNELKYKCELDKDYGDIPAIYCYPQLLNQVFMNLLINAAHAIEGQGTVSIRTRYDDNAVWISVADSGSGIPAELRRRIFEPFFTTKPPGQGTGLGLSIAMDIVRRHHGDMTVESEEGRGSAFTVRLPANASADDLAGVPT